MDFISNSKQDIQSMLQEIGVSSFEELIKNIPSSLRAKPLALAEGISELELMEECQKLGAQNLDFTRAISFLGAGVYDHFIPPLVELLAMRGEFATAYTPYQGEASQGTLQTIYEYQTLMCELTALDVSNASMYDGASALAEASLMALRSTNRKKILISSAIHPEYVETVKTYLAYLEYELVMVGLKDGRTDLNALKSLVDEETAGVLIQHPNFFGLLEEGDKLSEITHQHGALLVSCVNPISLGLLKSPGEYGADIAVGDGQPLGNPSAFGGPHFGFLTAKEAFLRKMPGRIAGMSVDDQGRQAFVLTLQAREQHIRREKATSNICTNHALSALKGTIFLSLLGRAGLKRLAELNFARSHEAYDRLCRIKGVTPLFKGPFFNEFTLKMDKEVSRVQKALLDAKILGLLRLDSFYPDLKNSYLVAVTEKRTSDDIERLASVLEKI